MVAGAAMAYGCGGARVIVGDGAPDALGCDGQPHSSARPRSHLARNLHRSSDATGAGTHARQPEVAVVRRGLRCPRNGSQEKIAGIRSDSGDYNWLVTNFEGARTFGTWDHASLSAVRIAIDRRRKELAR